MEINSPIGNLAKKLKEIVEKSKEFGQSYKSNEANTRSGLINPILTALGWDISNPSLVESELVYQNTKIDYALYDCEHKIKIIVEAKSLGTRLDDITVKNEVAKYAFMHKVGNVFLTNGVEWHHYTDFNPESFEPFIIDLRKDPLIDCAKELIIRLDASLFWPEKDSRKEEITQPSLEPAIKLAPNDEADFIPIFELRGSFVNKRPPREIRLPDGSIKPIGRWSNLLFECCSFVLLNNSSIPVPLKDKANGKIYLLNHQKPENPNYSARPTQYQGKTVFIFMGYDADDYVANAKYILSKLPESKFPFTAAVRFGR